MVVGQDDCRRILEDGGFENLARLCSFPNYVSLLQVVEESRAHSAKERNIK
jgi:hypothetical protein